MYVSSLHSFVSNFSLDQKNIYNLNICINNYFYFLLYAFALFFYALTFKLQRNCIKKHLLKNGKCYILKYYVALKLQIIIHRRNITDDRITRRFFFSLLVQFKERVLTCTTTGEKSNLIGNLLKKKQKKNNFHAPSRVV